MAAPEIKTEIKNESLDMAEDLEWEKAAEEEIMAANEGFNDDETESETEKSEKKVRPKRIRKPKLRQNFETDPDEPEEMSETERFDDEDNFTASDNDDEDPSFEHQASDDSYNPDLGDDDSVNSLDMFGI